MWLDRAMRVLRCVRAREFSEARFKCGMVSAWGPSSFFSQKMLSAVGGVDERFHYMMDSDLWLKFAHLGYRYVPLPGYAYGLRMHPDAKMSGHNFAESTQQDPNHPKWRQLANEAKWMHAGHDELAFTFLRRISTLGLKPCLRGWMDQLRMKGRHYAGFDNLG